MRIIMTSLRVLALACLLSASLLSADVLEAAEAPTERWFQVEMTVFTHENSNLELEIWSPDRLSLGFPERLRRLTRLTDSLQLDDWTVLTGPASDSSTGADGAGLPGNPVTSSTTLSPLAAATPEPVLVGPKPFAPGDSFRLPDFERDAFLALLDEDHDFAGSNRALSQSAAYRVLYHSAWRQPMTRRNRTDAIAISGGRSFNDRSELEGSVSFYFNTAEDRVVFDVNVWLSSFSTAGGAEQQWTLPPLPAALARQGAELPADVEPTRYFVNRIIQLRQTRDMRSDEFHYIDHPAMGILVQVTPYIVPEIPVTEPAVPQSPGTLQSQ